jgi:parvulin-like peptidyl-prolyl isomerase
VINDEQQVQLGDQEKPGEPEQQQEVSSMEYHALHILIMPDKEKERAAAAAKTAGHSLPANFNADAAAKKKAEDLLAQLSKGADFETLARGNSDDPGSGSKGGDLGWFRGGQMVPEFDKDVKALKAGQMSGLVKTKFGYHIIKLLETRG